MALNGSQADQPLSDFRRLDTRAAGQKIRCSDDNLKL